MGPSVLVVWLGLFLSFHGCNSMAHDECPPAEIGQPYTLKCTALTAGEVSSITWIAQDAMTGNDSRLADCSERCHNFLPDRYNATLPRSNFSLLTISNVTVSDENTTLYCYTSAGEKADSTNSVPAVCKLVLYMVPVTPVCRAQKLNSEDVKVTCNTSQAYPGIRCELYQHKVDHDPNIVVTTARSEEIRYFRISNFTRADGPGFAECSAVFSTESAGEYTYMVKMYPSLNGQNFEHSEAYSNKISTIPDPVVVLDDLTDKELYICPSRKNIVTLRCTASQFLSTPQFYWHIGNQKVMVDSKTEVVTNDTFPTYRNILEYELDESYQGKNVTCEVNMKVDKKLSQLLKITDSKTLNLNWPPSNLIEFKNQFGASLEGIIYVDKGNHSDVMCDVDKEESDISMPNVKCLSEDGSKTLLKPTPENKSVPFIVYGTTHFHKSTCTCTAEHMLYSCHFKANATFFVVSTEDNWESLFNANSTYFDVSTEDYWESLRIFGIVTGSIVGISFLLFVPLYLAYRKRQPVKYPQYNDYDSISIQSPGHTQGRAARLPTRSSKNGSHIPMVLMPKAWVTKLQSNEHPMWELTPAKTSPASSFASTSSVSTLPRSSLPPPPPPHHLFHSRQRPKTLATDLTDTGACDEYDTYIDVTDPC